MACTSQDVPQCAVWRDLFWTSVLECFATCKSIFMLGILSVQSLVWTESFKYIQSNEVLMYFQNRAKSCVSSPGSPASPLSPFSLSPPSAMAQGVRSVPNDWSVMPNLQGTCYHLWKTLQQKVESLKQRQNSKQKQLWNVRKNLTPNTCRRCIDIFVYSQKNRFASFQNFHWDLLIPALWLIWGPVLCHLDTTSRKNLRISRVTKCRVLQNPGFLSLAFCKKLGGV